MSAPSVLYVVESIRERGRVVVETICFSRHDAEEQRRLFANEQTPEVRVVEFDRRRYSHSVAGHK